MACVHLASLEGLECLDAIQVSHLQDQESRLVSILEFDQRGQASRLAKLLKDEVGIRKCIRKRDEHLLSDNFFARLSLAQARFNMEISQNLAEEQI